MSKKLKAHLVPASGRGTSKAPPRTQTQQDHGLEKAALEFWLDQWNGLESLSQRTRSHVPSGSPFTPGSAWEKPVADSIGVWGP